jgi:hypothetical protein
LAEIMVFRTLEEHASMLDQQVIPVMNVFKAEVQGMLGDPANWHDAPIVTEVHDSVRKLKQYLHAHRTLPAMEAELRELKVRKCEFVRPWGDDLCATYEKTRGYMNMLYDVLRMIPTAVGAEFGLAQYYGEECERLANLVTDAGSKFGVVMDEQGNLVEQEKL